MRKLRDFSYSTFCRLEHGTNFIFPKNKNNNVYEFVKLVEHYNSTDDVTNIVVCLNRSTNKYVTFVISKYETREIELVLI